jgi:hypothetical protein
MAQAGMIGTDQVAAPAAQQADRMTLLNMLGRSDVASQLQALGIDPAQAKDRVGAMTDQEVATLVGRVDSLPAGAMSDGAAVVLIIIIIAAIWWYMGKPGMR